MPRKSPPRLIISVQEAIETVCHDFDISRRDREPDAGEWNAVSIRIEELIERAYGRAHEGPIE